MAASMRGRSSYASCPGSVGLDSPATPEVVDPLQQLRRQLRDVQRQDQLVQRQTKAQRRLLAVIEEKQRLLEEKKRGAKLVQQRLELERETVRDAVERERRRKAQQHQQLERDFTEQVKAMEQTRREHQLALQQRRTPDDTLPQLVAEERRALKDGVVRSRLQYAAALQSNRREQQEDQQQRTALLRASQEAVAQRQAQQVVSQQQLHRENMLAIVASKFEEREALRRAELKARLRREERELKRLERLAHTAQSQMLEKKALAMSHRAALRQMDDALDQQAGP